MPITNSPVERSELNAIKKKLIWLYLLNITDVIFTLFLLSTGKFIEVNFVMAPIVNNNKMLCIYIKFVIPLLLFIWIFWRMRKASGIQLDRSIVIINYCIAFYGLINILHVAWWILYNNSPYR